MVDRYGQFGTEHLTTAPSRIERGRDRNVIDLSQCKGKQTSAATFGSTGTQGLFTVGHLGVRNRSALGGRFKEIKIRSEAKDPIPLRTSYLLEKPCFLQPHHCTRSGVVRNPELLLRGLNVRQRMDEQELKQPQLV